MANLPSNLGTVRVTIPALAAADLNFFKKSLKDIAERLGHPNCLSGRNCFFELERDFVYDPLKGDFSAHAISQRSDAKQLKVNVSAKVSHDLKLVNNLLDKIAELSGHTACATGCDMFFGRFQERIINARVNVSQQLEVTSFKASL